MDAGWRIPGLRRPPAHAVLRECGTAWKSIAGQPVRDRGGACGVRTPLARRRGHVTAHAADGSGCVVAAGADRQARQSTMAGHRGPADGLLCRRPLPACHAATRGIGCPAVGGHCSSGARVRWLLDKDLAGLPTALAGQACAGAGSAAAGGHRTVVGPGQRAGIVERRLLLRRRLDAAAGCPDAGGERGRSAQHGGVAAWRRGGVPACRQRTATSRTPHVLRWWAN